MKRLATCAWFLALTLTIVMGTSLSAAAQTAKAELSGGYQVTRVPDQTLPAGWYVDVAGNFTSMFSAVGEVAGAYKTQTVQVGSTSIEAKLKLHTYMGGGRVSGRINPKVVPFGQVLVGAAHASGGVTGAGTSIFSASDTEFALQAGGGVNLMLTNTIGVRVAADYRRIFSDDGENEFRAAFGVVIPFGK